MLNQSKTLLPFKARLQVYRSIFESHLNFATNVWSTNKNALSKLAPIQQKALKSVFLQPYRSHVTPLLPALNLLKREQLITAVRVKFVHNLRLRKLPTEFNNFVTIVNTNDDNTRASRFSFYDFTLIIDKSNPKYHISKSWNSLPFNLKSQEPQLFLGALQKYFNSSNETL